MVRLLPAFARVRPLFAGILFALAFLASTFATPLDNARARLRHGDYEGVITLARAVKADAPDDAEAWLRLELRALLDLGRSDEALQRLAESSTIALFSLPLRLLQHEASLAAGQPAGASLDAREVVRAMNIASAVRGPDYVRSADFQAAAGEASLLVGLEPRLVLENFLKPAQKARPPARRAFLVAGQLALDKRDFGLASRTFRDGLAAFPDDPDLLCGLAASFRNGDRKELVETARRALAVNPRHVPSLLLLAEHDIDAEQRDLASVQLDLALAVNPRSPEAHALRSVIAYFDRDPVEAGRERAAALATWQDNPRVDSLIGRKLAEQYQFADAAVAQRRALQFDPNYTPAKVELAQDLLRLADEDEGWALAEQAHRADPYNIEAFNLATLHDQLAQFTVVSSPHFRVRMTKDEAPIYGDRAVALLERARTCLTQRYGVALERPTTVEIYPDPKDFAVRTFGLPDIGGFLGVCFGPVFTINSPASAQANWEAVLWHEFTHVITLTLTRNRMPRWLSEGISVYEESAANPAWGQLMSLHYRERILDGKTLPISRMSSAFLEAQDSRDTQFAYFSSALVVQFLVERHGFPKLRELLQSLADGREMNDALAHTFAPLPQLDTDFAAYARDTALALGAGLDFRRDNTGLNEIIARHLPGLATLPNVHAALKDAREALDHRDWAAVRAKLAPLVADHLYLPGPDNYHVLLARAAAGLGDTAAEREALATVADHEGDALNSVTRLLALAEADQDWPAVAKWADRLLAINPLAPTPWRALLTANEHTGDRATAARAGEVLLRLDPPDFASLHYRVARQLVPLDPAAARRHVLQALEEAPRFRAAYDLLAQLPPATAATP